MQSVNINHVTLPREPEPLSTPEQPRHRGRTQNTAVTHPEADLGCLTMFNKVVEYEEKVLQRSSMTSSLKDL